MGNQEDWKIIMNNEMFWDYYNYKKLVFYPIPKKSMVSENRKCELLLKVKT